MSAVVTKSLPVVVRPSSEPAGSSYISLSSLDETYVCLPVTAVMVFDHPMDDPVETIKRALSQALVHYGAIAGRLTEEGNRIACTGEGVTFVGASASCPLALLPTLPISDLVLHYPEVLCRQSDPLALMQVTRFSCGGFTVALASNHALGDGKGMGQFWQALGELARGMPASSVPPVRSCELGVIPASDVATSRSLFKIAIQDMVPLDVTLPLSLISGIKAQYVCTVFDAVAAVLWRCRTRAAVCDPKAVVSLHFACDLRKHLDIQDGYYGNCFAMAQVHATAGSVANGEVGNLVNLIKRAKESVLLGSSNNGDQAQSEGRTTKPTMDQIKNQLYNAVGVVSWRNLGLEAVDFGHGTPSRVFWHVEHVFVPSYIVLPPCKGEDGVNVMSIAVKPEHVDAFLAELASM